MLNHDPALVSVEDRNLRAICDGCILILGELLQRLGKLKVQDGEKFRKYKCFRQALKSVWSKSAIDEILDRLLVFRKEMDGHVLASIRYSESQSIIRQKGRTDGSFYSEKFSTLSLL